MKIKFLGGPIEPDNYDIVGETVNGIDLSIIEEGDKFQRISETKEAGIYDAYREDGILYVTLLQKVIASQIPNTPAHWRGLDWVNAEDYDSSNCYVTPTGVADLQEGKDYVITKGTDVAKQTGWTIVNPKIEE